jgi:hypothetical protein
MSAVVHARLDGTTRQLLERLRRRTGLNDSEIVRRAIRTLAGLELTPPGRRIAGLGRFRSGIRDLGSNKARLTGFGDS